MSVLVFGKRAGQVVAIESIVNPSGTDFPVLFPACPKFPPPSSSLRARPPPPFSCRISRGTRSPRSHSSGKNAVCSSSSPAATAPSSSTSPLRSNISSPAGSPRPRGSRAPDATSSGSPETSRNGSGEGGRFGESRRYQETGFGIQFEASSHLMSLDSPPTTRSYFNTSKLPLLPLTTSARAGSTSLAVLRT